MVPKITALSLGDVFDQNLKQMLAEEVEKLNAVRGQVVTAMMDNKPPTAQLLQEAQDAKEGYIKAC